MDNNQCDQIGRLLALWAISKACGNNYFAQITNIFRQILYRCQNLSCFLWNHYCATFIDIWRLFTGHTNININQLA